MVKLADEPAFRRACLTYTRELLEKLWLVKGGKSDMPRASRDLAWEYFWRQDLLVFATQWGVLLMLKRGANLGSGRRRFRWSEGFGSKTPRVRVNHWASGEVARDW
jgi:hypothetical protein